jgi:hypothetical protein
VAHAEHTASEITVHAVEMNWPEQVLHSEHVWALVSSE